jgi:hypothetical protein
MVVHIVVDVESVGRDDGGVFCIAMCACLPDGERVTTVAHFHPKEDRIVSQGTEDWWYETESKRLFLEESTKRATSRDQAATHLRSFIDMYYTNFEDVVFWSDYVAFDLGMLNQLLTDAGHLPAFLRTDRACPSEMIDHTTMVLTLANMSPWGSSSEAFKKLGIERSKKADNHDAEVDVLSIMDDVLAVLDVLNK